MKSIFIIKAHSLIDVITNSSSEIFVMDSKLNLELSFVKTVILNKAKELGYCDDDLKKIDSFIYEREIDNYPFDEETIPLYIDFLRKKGYIIIEPEEVKPAYDIVLYCEMGDISSHSKLGQFIIETFNAEYDQC